MHEVCCDSQKKLLFDFGHVIDIHNTESDTIAMVATYIESVGD
jgi:hypothetical protein